MKKIIMNLEEYDNDLIVSESKGFRRAIKFLEKIILEIHKGNIKDAELFFNDYISENPQEFEKFKKLIKG